MASANQIACHRAAHVSKSDKANIHAGILQIKLVFAQGHQHFCDVNIAHIAQRGNFPFRIAVLVDDRGTDTFDKIPVRGTAVREPIFLLQHRPDRG